MLDRDETHIASINGLWAEYRNSSKPETREKLIEHYLPLVKLVAGRIAIGLPQYVDKDDLVGNGVFGLIEAIERYDLERGVKFETYAVARIRGAMLDSLRAQDWIPATVRQKARHYEETLASLEHSLGRSAGDEEIASALGISVTQLHNLLNTINGCTLIPLEDYLKVETPSSGNSNPSQFLEEEELKATLAKSIDKLTEKERLVITLYYYEGLTLKEISLILKLTEARISQLHTKAIFRLRGALSRVKSSIL
ncbi:MAG: FliA/WhiG family RNA polymerase sigma factor [Negativicutes bacterium]|nr:FliA/WhiG family RNA polymerase sigma factor [Negativicutes bacterium]